LTTPAAIRPPGAPSTCSSGDATAAFFERCVVAGGLRADQPAEAERLAYLLKFVRLFFGGIETFLQIDPSALQAFLRLAED